MDLKLRIQKLQQVLTHVSDPELVTQLNKRLIALKLQLNPSKQMHV